MDSVFVLKTVVSFVAAGVWIGGATLLAERLGSEKGGLISNLPATILISLLFVALVQDPTFAAKATEAVPVGMLIDTIFLLVFILLLKHGLVKTVLLSLGTWLGLAFLAGRVHSTSLFINIVLYTVTAVGAYLWLEYRVDIPVKAKNRKKYSPASLLVRALFAGGVVAGAIILSTFAGTYWVGLFSTFPAVMLSTMVILAVNQGPDFARAVGKVMILSSTNIIIYAAAVSVTYPSLGAALGTLVSFGAAFLWILLLRPVIQKISR